LAAGGKTNFELIGAGAPFLFKLPGEGLCVGLRRTCNEKPEPQLIFELEADSSKVQKEKNLKESKIHIAYPRA